MPKPEWGVKRACPSCAARYYDMMRSPIICPECGAPFEVATKDKAASLKADLERAKSVTAAEAEDLVDDGDVVEETASDDDDDTLLEDDDDGDAAAGPALSDEESDDEPVEFDDTVLIDDDEDDNPIEDLGDVPVKDENET